MIYHILVSQFDRLGGMRIRHVSSLGRESLICVDFVLRLGSLLHRPRPGRLSWYYS